ncbi:MAG: hypothetical protein Q8O25_14955 [Sulfurisoma sp.]|nr:hypothetical protein [Sulfurisoma sp.]
MKIASSDLFLRSEHAAVARWERSETLRAWAGSTRPDFEGSREANDRRLLPSAAVMRISDAARALATSPNPAPGQPPVSGEAQAIEAAADAVENDPFLQLVRSMVEMLTGRPVRVFAVSELSRQVEASSEMARATAAASPDRRSGYGIEYDFHSVYEEMEVAQFSAEGMIRTADGAEISFELDLTMTRQYREETNVSLRAGDAVRKDPLVLNFGGTAAQLSNQNFRFDLDNDGRAEELPLFASASGYLVLDLDHNGKIDSGAELFGPATNSGFAELARHDDDGNGWIDESDRVFDRLQVWTPAAGNAGKLAGLRELGIGALALAHVATPFELRGEANSDLGAVRASGVWLAEFGGTGTIQEIDLSL